MKWFLPSTVDFEGLLGAPWAKIAPEVKSLIHADDLAFGWLEQERRDEVIREESRIERKPRPTPEKWGDFWQEVKALWDKSRDPRQLVPPFLCNPATPLRFLGEYVIPRSPLFLYQMQQIILTHLIREYAVGARVLEFGCGSGFNLLRVRELLPKADLYGLDFAEAAVELVAALGLNALRFDLRDPRLSPIVAHQGTVLTMGALEQLGKKAWQPFLLWLLTARPRVCIHVEPFAELYNSNVLLDDLALRYHRARGYFERFLPALSELEKSGKAEILEVHRTQLGARHNDGFSWVAWRPI